MMDDRSLSESDAGADVVAGVIDKATLNAIMSTRRRRSLSAAAADDHDGSNLLPIPPPPPPSRPPPRVITSTEMSPEEDSRPIEMKITSTGGDRLQPGDSGMTPEDASFGDNMIDLSRSADGRSTTASDVGRFLDVPTDRDISRRRTSSATHGLAGNVNDLLLGATRVSDIQNQRLGHFTKNKRNYSAFNLSFFGRHLSTNGSLSPVSPSPSPSLNALAALFGVRRSASSSALSDQPQGGTAWARIGEVVMDLFKGAPLTIDTMCEVHEKLRILNKSSFGPLMCDYLLNRLVPKGMHVLRDGIMGALATGNGRHGDDDDNRQTDSPSDTERYVAFVDSLAATWTNFYKSVSSDLAFLFCEVETRGLSISDQLLAAFRDLIILKIPLRDALVALRPAAKDDSPPGATENSKKPSDEKNGGQELGRRNVDPKTSRSRGKEKKSPFYGISQQTVAALQQMFNIVQCVHDNPTPAPLPQQLALEKLLVLVVNPYVGYLGYYYTPGQEYPDVPARQKAFVQHQHVIRRRPYLRMHSHTAASTSAARSNGRLYTDSVSSATNGCLTKNRVNTMNDLLL